MTTTANYWLKYSGIPYVSGGDNPNGFNCWGFLRYALAHEFGKTLPPIPLGDAERIQAIHSGCLESGWYSPVGTPEHGDAVLLRGGDSPHVGLYLVLDGIPGIMHALEPHGMTWTKIANLRRLGFGRIQYYRVS